MAATRASNLEKDHEQDPEENDFARRPHTAHVELDCILSHLPSLCVIDTFLKLVDQMLLFTQVLLSQVNGIGVMT